MANRRTSRDTLEVPALTRLWLLRLLLPLGGHREFIQRHGFRDDALAEILGLEDWIEPCDREFEPRAVRADLRKQHSAGEKELGRSRVEVCLSGNVRRLANLVGLSDADCRILEFAVLIQNERLLEDAADWLGNLSSVKLYHSLSVVLGIPESVVRQSLSPQSVLSRSGLLSVERGGATTLRHKLDLISDQFADHISSTDSDPVTLIRDMVAPSTPGTLGIADFAHVQDSLEILRPYLKRSMAVGRRGVNVFIHGAPGTGKNELSKTLAAELGCELFEVASENGDGDPIDGERRLRAFRAAQSFFGERKALIVFDEVEDVFNDSEGMFGRRSTAQRCKAWINRMLEDNPVPTLWLSNSIHGLDPAFIRRFDMVIELPVPPRKQRERIINMVCADLLDPVAAMQLASSDALAPAVVSRAASVVRSISNDLAAGAAPAALVRLIAGTLEAQGHSRIPTGDLFHLPDFYDPDFIQADSDLESVATGLVRTRAGRLCLYGPPGTGKTAYAHWVADQMGVPLHITRASEILSKWLGEDEKNIARAFRNAEREGAILVFDEVDSFLQDRRGAAHSWQVTLVNEMLTQMESFAGVFIASTNLMNDLDQAALRRFDLKVKFDFLRPEQAWGLLARCCRTLQFPEPSVNLRSLLDRLSNLTPGDYAAVVRQHRFRPLEAATDVISALAAECALKEGSRSPIGFC